MSKHGKVIPHLTVKGGMDAVKFYEEAFDAEVETIMMAEDGARVLHAELEINDCPVYLSDEFPEMPMSGNTAAPLTAGGASVAIHLALKKAKQVDRIIAQATALGASVVLPPSDMFWGERYGRVRDPFGHVWSLGAPAKKKDKDS